MLALLFTVLFALYLLGPDLLARWLLSFVVPRKAVVQSRSEEITRAVIWAVFPFLIALWGTSLTGVLARNHSWATLRTLFAGLYSDGIFRADPDLWFRSAAAFTRINTALLGWMYGTVFGASLLLALLTSRYASLRRVLPYGFLRDLLARLVLPRVAEWHVMLSDMLLPAGNLLLEADILTRSGLYRGRIQDKALGPDGNLRSITLDEPKRFQKELYLAAREKDGAANSSGFWAAVPGNMFVIVGSEVLNLNLRYIAPPGQVVAPTQQQKDALRDLLAQLT